MDSPVEILIVLAIAMVLFGPTRLPKLARSLGEAMKELKSGFAAGASGPATGGPEAEPEQPQASSDSVAQTGGAADLDQTDVDDAISEGGRSTDLD